MSRDLKPSMPSLIQFQQDLKLNGKGIRTQQSYLRAIRKFAEFLQGDPENASENDLRRYLLHIVEVKKWRPSTVNVAHQALKQFYRLSFPRDWKTLQLARVKVEQKIPIVLSVGEVNTFLKLIDKPAMSCFFTVVYSLGFRFRHMVPSRLIPILGTGPP